MVKEKSDNGTRVAFVLGANIVNMFETKLIKKLSTRAIRV